MWEFQKTCARRGCTSRGVSIRFFGVAMRYPRCSDGPNQGYTPPTRQQLLSTWGDDSQAVSPMEDSERLTIMSLSRPNTQHTAAGLPYDRDSELVATRRKNGGHERTLVPLYSRSSLAVRSAALSTLKQLDQPRPLTSWSSASWSATSSASQESKEQQWVTMLGTRGNTILGKLRPVENSVQWQPEPCLTHPTPAQAPLGLVLAEVEASSTKRVRSICIWPLSFNARALGFRSAVALVHPTPDTAGCPRRCRNRT